MSAWVEQIFKAKAARSGGIVRRRKTSVAKYASEAELAAAVKKRGFHMIEIADQYVVFCRTGRMSVIVP